VISLKKILNHLVLISKMLICEPSRRMQQRAEEKVGPPGTVAPEFGRALSSPYVHEIASEGLNMSMGEPIAASLGMTTTPVGLTFTTPNTTAITPAPDPNAACTFVDSVMSLCKRSTATSGVTDEPVPCEDIFLLLVQWCGIAEAKYWAEILRIEHRRSYSLLSVLLSGQQFSNRPNVIG
jgi:hypothetical protein